MRTRRFLTLLAAAALLVLGSGIRPSTAQEVKGKPAPGRAAVVTVVDTSGETHRIIHSRMFSEQVGLLSVSLEPSDTFEFKVGAARVKVPVRKIAKIEFSGGDRPGEWTTVTVTDHAGQSVSGKPDAPDKAEIRGERADAPGFARLELPLDAVKSITFEPTTTARVCPKCKTPWQDPEWKYCPRDGQRLPKIKK